MHDIISMAHGAWCAGPAARCHAWLHGWQPASRHCNCGCSWQATIGAAAQPCQHAPGWRTRGRLGIFMTS